MFDTILIANRGEIACRIMATCARMGIRSVAVYSDADANARHVRMAAAAVRIGPPPALESYLNMARIIGAARQTGAQAIHPGYGFLAENAEFAEACAAAGMVFIGPSSAAMRAMGSKATAKILMRDAGVPLTPGYDGSNQDPEFLRQQADAIGYPIMIKANAGGGGKGMRRVDRPEDFQSALASCRREAAAAFGDDSVLLEKYLVDPRHVEVQVFGDTHGNVLSLFERDCSVQRRHQKVIEEAPAPNIAPALRESLSEAARQAARAVNYVGAGTVEFLVDRDGGFHFMEMNTRLQVEHPVTEMITGLDLVEWQLRVAAGEPLPLRQEEISLRGHAIEARIYAEDPAHDFLPSIGPLLHLRTPAPSPHVRIDTGVEQGDTITPFYDPMIAKLIVWDETREAALQRLVQALREFQVVGVANNVAFLDRLVTSPSFRTPRLDTSLIDRERQWIAAPAGDPEARVLMVAALYVLLREGVDSGLPPLHSPWAARDGWRLNSTLIRNVVLAQNDRVFSVTVQYVAGAYRMTVGEHASVVHGERSAGGELLSTIDGERIRATVVASGDRLHVFFDSAHAVVSYRNPLDGHAGHHAGESSLLAPMPGRVIARSVEPGQRVAKGDALMVLEAMKMECTVRAPADGVVEAFHFDVGDQLTEGAELLRFEADDDKVDG